MTLDHQLLTSINALKYDFSPGKKEVADQLLHYVALINKWNRVHNLTAIRNTDEILTHHIVDSLSVLPHIKGSVLVDIGSGAGLPGIPIAIANPNWRIVLIERNQKKAAFLQQVRIELKLNNLEIFAKRAEHYQSVLKLNTIISRALSSLNDFINIAGHLCAGNDPDCRMVAMKGKYVDEQNALLPEAFLVERIVPVNVPGLNAERHLVIIKKVN
ncbi:MAG: 16S rRNA (guanine(527)-N(7))-methyltransferase RsmG [Nitrosomonas sp.]|nr:16S rRNA (guanine(527)-N(7))-methyltransferase RsmG [Nitrosomonas sp.]